MGKTQAEGFGFAQKSRAKLYLRMLMRLTEKFGANDLTAPTIKRCLDAHLQQNPVIDNLVSYIKIIYFLM